MDSLAERIKEYARRLGFDLAGIAPAAPADGFDHFQDWLAQRFAGDMTYLGRHAAAHRDPASILANVRSVVMVGLNYHASHEETVAAPRVGTGRVSVYARGQDYHEVLRQKLGALLSWLQEQVPGTQGRAVVDTAPLLERDFARRAGLGWFGKNTMLLNKKFGSFFFLGALLLDLEIPADEPFCANHCGSCTACLDACPTDAFAAPYVLDARRCISYLTIELRGSIPEELRSGMGDWIFGCDVCQDVCPWNRKAPTATEPAFQPRADLENVDLIELLELTEEEFRRRFRHTALWRTRRRGLLRNAAIALGNSGDVRALPALRKALADPEPLVREAAEWAIAKCDHNIALMDYLAIQVVMMPRDTNPLGSIFGGVILSYIDQAGAIGAKHEIRLAGGGTPFLVTVAVNRVEFQQPVLVGDVVRFLTRQVRLGRTSITMHVTVEVDRDADVHQVTEAEVVYVAVDPVNRRPMELLPAVDAKEEKEQEED